MGYDPGFVGIDIPLPELLPATAAQALNGGAPIEHTNHSIVFNEHRGLAVYAAHNIDGNALVDGIDRRSFTFDPLVENALQIDNDRGYKFNPWDAGHLARRKGVHWPDVATAEQAERDTSRWTNIAPQHSMLNQGPWLDVEDWLLDLADSRNQRMAVFTGPVFTATDLELTNMPDELPILIPSGYWKVGAFVHNGLLRAAAFLIWQNDVQPSVEDFNPDDFDPVLEQVRVLTIEHLTGVSFGDVIRQADPLRFGEELAPEIMARLAVPEPEPTATDDSTPPVGAARSLPQRGERGVVAREPQPVVLESLVVPDGPVSIAPSVPSIDLRPRATFAPRSAVRSVRPNGMVTGPGDIVL